MKSLPYHDYGTWLSERLPYKVQRLPIDAGLSCPNRRGRATNNGCIYCNNKAFSPRYSNPDISISQQITQGKKFFEHKRQNCKYLAYFQSYTNTYAPNDKLKLMYEEALADKDIVGLVIATRPDCINENLLDYWQELKERTFLIIEYGIESTNDKTLKVINRGHDFECTKKAIEQTTSRDIITGGHVILGLPGEDETDILNQASIVSSLPLQVLKIHHLQIIKDTKIEEMYNKGEISTFDMESYVRLLSSYLQRIREDIAIDRLVSQSPKDMLIAPNWHIKPFEFNQKLRKYMEENGMRQGQYSMP